jgi:hypothetical protein
LWAAHHSQEALLIPLHLMSMLDEDDGEEVGQEEGHSGAVAVAAAHQEV